MIIINAIIKYLSSDWKNFLNLILQHLLISSYALIISILIGVLLGYMSYKNRTVQIITTQFFQFLRIIPSLAILVLIMPILGTGLLPTIVALIILGIPPILLNTIIAFMEVSAEVLENAEAMGLTNKDILFKIQIPLAIPTILSGIKTSSIEIIASATLASKIGAGGLGDLIFTGLGLNDMGLVFIGGVTVACITLIIVQMMTYFEQRLLKYRGE